MSRFAEIIDLEEFIVTDTGMLLITEDYLERIAVCEGWVTKNKEYGVSSTELCDVAFELGMINLGDLGDGFIFVHDIYRVKEENEELYGTMKEYGITA